MRKAQGGLPDRKTRQAGNYKKREAQKNTSARLCGAKEDLMEEMKWYKVWLVVPGTDCDVGGWPCEPEWWNDMEQAPDEETAVRQANEKAGRQWEEPNYYEPGVEVPSDREMGQECPVCTGATEVTDEEYAEWKREMEEPVELPFQ